MAKLTVKVPKLGLTIETVKLVEWAKDAGDAVTAGETIATIEADKSSYEVEAPAAGTLAERLVPADDDEELPIGTPIAVIEVG